MPPESHPGLASSWQGRTLADESSSSASETAAAAAAAIVASGGAWPSASRPLPVVDESAPTTEVQVRVSGSPPQRLKLNRAHTIADLKALLEKALEAAAVAPRAYVLSAGFPPKPLVDEAATLEAAGLLSAAVTHRWA